MKGHFLFYKMINLCTVDNRYIDICIVHIIQQLIQGYNLCIYKFKKQLLKIMAKQYYIEKHSFLDIVSLNTVYNIKYYSEQKHFFFKKIMLFLLIF